MADLMYRGFVLQEEGFAVPVAFGMYTEPADKLVSEALGRFFARAVSWAKKQPSLESAKSRLELLAEHVDVCSEGGNDLENYFGDPLQYPHDEA